MKQLVFLLTLLIAPVPSSGQDVNRTSQLVQQVRAVERHIDAAMASRDRATLERLIADDFLFIHSNGPVETKRDYIEKIAAQTLERQTLANEVLDKSIRTYGGHTAV